MPQNWIETPSPIPRNLLLEHLDQARRHVAEGAEHVVRQRELVARMERDGHDTAEARRLLGQFEEMQALHVADRDRIEDELARCSASLLPRDGA